LGLRDLSTRLRHSRCSAARFPAIKTIEEFDLTHLRV
jgi:hypothetical protein